MDDGQIARKRECVRVRMYAETDISTFYFIVSDGLCWTNMIITATVPAKMTSD